MDKYRVLRITTLLGKDSNILVEDSKNEGFRFVERLVTEYKNGSNQFNKQGEALYGVYSELNTLIAVGGINIDPFSNDEKVGRLRRFYVKKEFRRQGVGSILLRKIIQEAADNFSVLTLKTDTLEGDQFYTSFGFTKGNQYLNSTHCFKLK
ncbi:GNAT family N-acetyltransferase [Ornithinibacillus sp. 179-J 7C1 HS]|uniref:GNAT family N-acetyltransferase n=1 Tax=Ornithinibacillus sp. 179-J 7C1 HS TaxID=3142384 RepID=UPI0039A2ED8E